MNAYKKSPKANALGLFCILELTAEIIRSIINNDEEYIEALIERLALFFLEQCQSG